MYKNVEQINVYDMLVFEDESGSIYQDCVCSIEKGCFGNLIKLNRARYETHRKRLSIHEWFFNGVTYTWVKWPDNTYKLKEIWTRTDEDTYKKVYELVDGKLTKISYSQGMKVYHRRQEVTYDQIKKFMVKNEESMEE